MDMRPNLFVIWALKSVQWRPSLDPTLATLKFSPFVITRKVLGSLPFFIFFPLLMNRSTEALNSILSSSDKV